MRHSNSRQILYSRIINIRLGLLGSIKWLLQCHNYIQCFLIVKANTRDDRVITKKGTVMLISWLINITYFVLSFLKTAYQIWDSKSEEQLLNHKLRFA